MYNISFTFMKVQRGRHALPLTDEETEYLHSQNSFKNQFHKKEEQISIDNLLKRYGCKEVQHYYPLVKCRYKP